VRNTSSNRLPLIMYILYSAIALIFIAPLLYISVSSLKPDLQIVSDMSSIKGFLPYGDLSLSNYLSVIQKMDFFKYFRNSAISTILTVIFGTLINAMLGYSLGMLEFKGKKLILSLMIAMMIIPTEAVIINRMLIAFHLKMLDTMTVLVVPALAYPMYVFLFYSHFKGMPKELMQAAVIDGASYEMIFTRIMFPLSQPVIATVAIMTFIRRWGELLWPTLVTRTDRFRTLPQAMRSLFTNSYVYWGEIFAYGVMVTIPTVIIFLLFQKPFIQSIAMTGIKG